MSSLNKSRIVEEFKFRFFGAKGWMTSESMPCPFCGGKDKFGILFNEDGKSAVYHCFKCDKKGSVKSLLRKIGRADLIISKGNEHIEIKQSLEGSLKFAPSSSQDIECSAIEKPLAFRELNHDDYLEGRGWLPWQFKAYHAGTSIDPKLKNKVVFLLYEKGEVVGWIARSKFSKEWHKENLKDFKAGKGKLVLRYENSRGTEFEKVVGGIDEIVEGETDTVILVEGIMDKANTDKVLGLNEDSSVKCCFTFGCKLSIAQMEKIYQRKVKNIILLYDPGTIQQVKSASINLSKKFNIFIGEIKGEKDPGEMNLAEFEDVFSRLISPMDYYTNRVQKIDLM